MPADVSAAITAGGAGDSVAVTNTVPGQNMKLTFTAGSNQKVSIKMNQRLDRVERRSSGTTVTLLKGSTTGRVPDLRGHERRLHRRHVAALTAGPPTPSRSTRRA